MKLCKRFSAMSNDKTQSDKFKEAARELECDEDERRFDADLKKIAKAGKEKVKCLACNGSGIADESTQKHFHHDDDAACKNCKGTGWV